MKRTKIVCTIGPASTKANTITRMVRAGMNVARLNFSHGTHAQHRALMRTIRGVAKKTGEPIAILQDLSGPKMRIGEVPDDGISLRKGASLVLSCSAKPSKGTVPLQVKTLYKDVRKGDHILLDDGLLELVVQRVDRKDIVTKVVVGGLLKSHKGVNVPGATLSVRTITQKDKEDLRFGLQQGVDIVSLSFIRSAKDVVQLRALIKRRLPKGKPWPLIVGKIEMKGAVDDIDAILQQVDAVMIARGDLALETKGAAVPVVQKKIAQKAIAANRAVIVATEMLGSMVSKPRPTRAEISDVANAVIDHTDATMLSGESATGKYPVEAVRTMAEIIIQTEQSVFDDYLPAVTRMQDFLHHDELAGLASLLARSSDVSALLVDRSAAHLSSHIRRFRPELPIVVNAHDSAHAQRLNLLWGVFPRVFALRTQIAAMRRFIRAKKLAKKGSVAVVFSLHKDQIEMKEVEL